MIVSEDRSQIVKGIVASGMILVGLATGSTPVFSF